MVVAALLLLVLGFAGYWIVTYLDSGGAPWRAVPWFVAAAAVIIVVGFVTGWLRAGGNDK
jgi:hypothetical protein